MKFKVKVVIYRIGRRIITKQMEKDTNAIMYITLLVK